MLLKYHNTTFQKILFTPATEQIQRQVCYSTCRCHMVYDYWTRNHHTMQTILFLPASHLTFFIKETDRIAAKDLAPRTPGLF